MHFTGQVQSVRLTFEATPADTKAEPPQTARKARTAPPSPRPSEKRIWQMVGPQTKLIEVGQSEFRLSFRPDAWQRKIDQPQLLTDGSFATTPTSPRNKPYCAWRVGSRADVAQLIGTSRDASVLHSLEFRKQLKLESPRYSRCRARRDPSWVCCIVCLRKAKDPPISRSVSGSPS